jgi:hypothetical protein
MRMNMSSLPRISMITPSFQQAPMLDRCLRSVASQGDGLVQHIVIDGGSTDGSRDIIAAHAGALSFWCCEPDQGQSDALNKGLSHATGEVFGWLNSDDVLLPGALRKVAEVFAADPGLVLLEGARVVVQEDGQRSTDPQNSPSDLRALFIEPKVNQQALFFRMEAVRAVGGFDAALNLVMDLELLWRVLFMTGGAGLRVIRDPLAEFRMHAQSKTSMHREGFRHEQAGVLHGLCMLHGEHELARILAIGYQWPAGIRSMPMAWGQPERVRDMAVHFLLKWDRQLFSRDSFERMQALLQWQGIHACLNDPLHGPRIAEARAGLTSATWAIHRVKKKINHLLR